MPRKNQKNLIYHFTKKNVLDVAKSVIKQNFKLASAGEKDSMYKAIEARVASGKVHDYGRLIKQLERTKKAYNNKDTRSWAKKQSLKSIAGLKNWTVTNRYFPNIKSEKERINRLFSDYEEYYYDDEVNEQLHDYLDLKKEVESKRFKKYDAETQKELKLRLEDLATIFSNSATLFKFR